MDETRKFQKKRVCRGCRAVNDWEAKQCAECGADLEATDEQFADDDPKLRYVDTENRTEIDRVVRLDEAELACGLLRANGIACELSPPVLPGVPGEMILWVNNQDAELAWALLADAEREAAEQKDEDAA